MSVTAIVAAKAIKPGWELLRAHWPKILAGIALLGLVVALFFTRATLATARANLSAEQNAHKATVANYRKAAADAEASDKANAWRVALEQKEITDAVTEDYQSQLDNARARYERLRAQAAADPGGRAGAAVPGVSAAACRADGTAAQAGLPGPDALTATEQAIQLKALQDWVLGQSAIEVNGDRP